MSHLLNIFETKGTTEVTQQILNLVLQSYLQAPKLKLKPCDLCNYSGYTMFL